MLGRRLLELARGGPGYLATTEAAARRSDSWMVHPVESVAEFRFTRSAGSRSSQLPLKEFAIQPSRPADLCLIWPPNGPESNL